MIKKHGNSLAIIVELDLNIGSSISLVGNHALVTSGLSPAIADDGSDTMYEASNIGTPWEARDHLMEIWWWKMGSLKMNRARWS